MKERERRRKRASRHNWLQSRMIILILILVLGTVAFNGYRTYTQLKEYARQEKELDLQISQAEARKEELQNLEEYMKTDAYKEQVAREEFGLIKKGEYVLKDKNLE